MADNKKYKVGITVKEPWANNISYEQLDMTLFAVENGGDGCAYVALKPNIGVRPNQDPTTWIKATQRGQSIYDYCIEYGLFVGTEEEFAQDYADAVQAAKDAAASATHVEEDVSAAEQGRVSAENARVSAESQRASAEESRVSHETQRSVNETGRVNAEDSRVAAENARVVAENQRASAESTRATNEESRRAEFGGMMRDAETAIGLVDSAMTEAENVDATVDGMIVTITDRHGVSKSVNIGFDIYRTYGSVAAMNADAANVEDGKFVMIATLDPTSTENAQLWVRNSNAATSQNPFTFLSDLDQASSAAWADWMENQKPIIEADHATAVADHTQAVSDHTNATNDHAVAGQDHTTAGTDHTQAVSDSTRAGQDHLVAEQDHTRAEGDHTTASTDHSTAQSDHTTAHNDNVTATSDHTLAVGDHTTATEDHTQAVSDHTTAAADHATAVNDHAAVEVYVDSLGAFDLSKYNAVGGVLATYADLSAALTALNALDSKYKYGGMSIKFVQSSDNKYVQFRLMNNTWSIDTSDWALCSEDVLVENPEFVYVKTDKDNRILWAIKTDGTIYYGAGVPQQVIDYIEEKIADLSLDEYEDIVAFLSYYLGSDTTLKEMIDNINERIPELIENPEFIEVKEDADGRVLNGVRKDGVKVEYRDVIYPNGIPKQIYQYLPKSIKESNPLSFGSNYRGNSQTLNEPSYLITLSNVYNDKKGWLKTVRFYTNTAGTKTLHIGYIDQRSTAIIRLSFNCNAIAGFNEVDISKKHIIIEENETLFITANSISFDALGSTDNYPQMLSGQSNGVLERYDSEYGASLYFNWDVVEVSSLYSFKVDTDTIEENVGSLSSSVNALEKNINKVYDNNGNAYKLKIINGELTPILQQFGNVLVIGNSVTRHPYNDSPGTRWLASSRGMASTIIDNDYCHLLREGLRVKVPQAQVTTCDGYQWERNLPTDKNTLRAYLEDYSGSYDLVVFALSENITSTDSNLIYNSCKAFFEVILEKWPDTTVLVTSTRMCIGESPNSIYGYKDIAIQKAARAMKFDYADVRQRDYDAFVTNFNTGVWIPIYMNGDNGKFVAQKTVHTHPCDIGMLRIANDILVAIDCQPLENKIFQIATSCSQDYYAPTYWVDGGLVTVICYEETPQVVTVTDSDGNNISFEIKDMTIEVIDVTPSKSPIAGIVFTMPSSNVIISIN